MLTSVCAITGDLKVMPESWHYHQFMTEDWDMYFPFPTSEFIRVRCKAGGTLADTFAGLKVNFTGPVPEAKTT